MKVALIGFEDIGQALVRLLLQKMNVMETKYDLQFIVTGIYSTHYGSLINPNGVDMEAALELAKVGNPINNSFPQSSKRNIIDFIETCDADVLFDCSTSNPKTGQPAIDFLSKALQIGMHVITSNVSVITFGYNQLQSIGVMHGKRFLYGAALMEARPLIRQCSDILIGVKLLSFQGVVDTCINRLLTQIESAGNLEQTTDGLINNYVKSKPSDDFTGWDAACKVAALIIVLMDNSFNPDLVQYQGIQEISAQVLNEANKEGKKVRYICSAQYEEKDIKARAMFELVSPDSSFYSVGEASSHLQFNVDELGYFGLVENNINPESIAYGLLADFISLIRECPSL